MKGWPSLSAPFIFRPIATMLLTIGLALAGGISYFLLPVAPLPQVDYPTISVTASLPGAAPDTMAATVATPLERALGAIAGVNEMTSSSSLGNTRITLQFDLSRTVDSAARDVQAAINAARTLLPSGMPSNPTYRKINPADAPILMLALTSDSLTRGQMYDAASTVLAQKLSQVEGVGQASIQGRVAGRARGARPCTACGQRGIAGAGTHSDLGHQCEQAAGRGGARGPLLAGGHERPGACRGRLCTPRAQLVEWQCDPAAGRGRCLRLRAGRAQLRRHERQAGDPAAGVQAAGLQYSRGGDACARIAAAAQGVDSGGHRHHRRVGPHTDAAGVGRGGGTLARHLHRTGDSGGVPVPAEPAGHADPGRGRSRIADGNVRRDVPVRLHARQPLAHGADGGHGLRCRRCDRGAGERHAPYGEGQVRRACGA